MDCRGLCASGREPHAMRLRPRARHLLGRFRASFLNTPDAKKLLGLPEEWISVAPIIVGYPQAVPIDVPRKAPTVLHIG